MRVGSLYIEMKEEDFSRNGKTVIPIQNYNGMSIEVWRQNGEIHRMDGPARILRHNNSITQELFYIGGTLKQKHIKISQENFDKAINKKYFFCEIQNKNYNILEKVCETHCKEKVYLSICDEMEKCFLIFSRQK